MSDIQAQTVERKTLPMRYQQFDVANFAAWLAKNGAEIGIPTNPYEVIRYRAYSDGKPRSHIIYAKESGLLTWPGETQAHYLAFLAGETIGPGYPKNEAGDAPFLRTTHSRAAYNELIRKAAVRAGKAGADPDVAMFPAQVPKTAPTRAALLERDGDHCWFCGLKMGDDVTIEHLVPKSAGGRNMLANYALAHAACNHRAANLPLVEKIEMRQKMRSPFAILGREQ